MKMHFLSGGRLRMKKGIYVPDAAREETIELPVISTLFKHAKGNVLFDTGCHPSVETDAEARWGGLSRVMVPIAPPKSDVVSSLADINLAPEDIDVVINSHFHPDHCGCNEFFKNASFICHEKELEAAQADNAASLGYLAADWDHPMPMQAVGNEHDVMGDGRLVTQHLPGHTAGLIGLKAALDKSGEFFIVSDAVTLERNLENDEVPRNAWNAEALLQSYDKIRAVQKTGAKMICGHDDVQWKSLKTGANFYD